MVCEDCVRSDFATVKKLVFTLLAIVVLGNGRAVFASQDMMLTLDQRP